MASRVLIHHTHPEVAVLATVSDSALVPELCPPAATDVGWKTLAPGVEINEAAWTPAAERILTPSALHLVVRLHRELQEEEW